jgi:hypothetical protein
MPGKGSTPAISLRSRERPESALCSQWLTTRPMGEDAPHLPFAISAGIGSVGWRADLSPSRSGATPLRWERLDP